MADFCRKCSIKMFGNAESGGMVGLCKPGQKCIVLCETCGYVLVDHEGRSGPLSQSDRRMVADTLISAHGKRYALALAPQFEKEIETSIAKKKGGK